MALDMHFPGMVSTYNSRKGDDALVIHKPIYESLPYLYLAVGIVVVLALHSPLTYLSGALLYAAGAMVWVMRSAYRRCNEDQATASRRSRPRLPDAVYEYLPFLYIAIGVAVIVGIDSPLRFLPGALFCLAGVLVWMIRAIYRSRLAREAIR